MYSRGFLKPALKLTVPRFAKYLCCVILCTKEVGHIYTFQLLRNCNLQSHSVHRGRKGDGHSFVAQLLKTCTEVTTLDSIHAKVPFLIGKCNPGELSGATHFSLTLPSALSSVRANVNVIAIVAQFPRYLSQPITAAVGWSRGS